MTELCNLLGDEKPVFLDPRTGGLGGSFYNNPHLQPYSPLPLKWAYDQLMRYPSAVLLDVGASTGCFSLLSRHHPDLEVWAFEPVELTYAVLRENIYLNELQDKVHAHRLGVSNYNGKGMLYEIKADGGKGVSIVNGTPDYHKDCNEIEIDVVTIDTFCALHDIVPTFIKIDTEGQEKFVLEGAKETIEKHHPFLLYEYSQQNADQFHITAHDTIAMIESWGYQWSNPEGMDVWAVPLNWETLIK